MYVVDYHGLSCKPDKKYIFCVKKNQCTGFTTTPRYYNVLLCMSEILGQMAYDLKSKM